MSSRELERIESLRKKQAEITARLQAEEARYAVKERKRDTRRKILVGSYYIEQARKNEQWEKVKERMDEYLTRDSDRELFDLPKRTKKTEAVENASVSQ
jgi:large subunit ribosomal protein L7/L12